MRARRAGQAGHLSEAEVRVRVEVEFGRAQLQLERRRPPRLRRHQGRDLRADVASAARRQSAIRRARAVPTWPQPGRRPRDSGADAARGRRAGG